MDLSYFQANPPWEWPENAGEFLYNIFQDQQAELEDRLLAAEFAGDMVVISDEIARALLSIVADESEDEELRGQAAISLGPILEHTDLEGFDDPEEIYITEQTFDQIKSTFAKLYQDESVPKQLRRKILEISVRASQDWPKEAVRAAYQSEDQDWKLTAVFCMQYLSGFEHEILESLNSENEDIHYFAVRAAGNWELDKAWQHIADLASSEQTEKELRLAAIEDLASIKPDESIDILMELTNSEDEDIVDCAHESLAMAKGFWGFYDDLDDEDDVFD